MPREHRKPASLRRLLLGAAALCIATLCGTLRAQENTAAHTAANGPPDEIIVSGKRIGTLRKELELAQDSLYEAFNANNSDDELDIHCREEVPTGSHIPRRVCRPEFVDTATSRAGQAFVESVIHHCFLPQKGCPLEDGPAGIAGGAAQVSLGNLKYMAERLDNEMQQLIRSNPQVAKAAAEYQTERQAYQQALKEHNR